jgi:hypothetical protein
MHAAIIRRLCLHLHHWPLYSEKLDMLPIAQHKNGADDAEKQHEKSLNLAHHPLQLDSSVADTQIASTVSYRQ